MIDIDEYAPKSIYLFQIKGRPDLGDKISSIYTVERKTIFIPGVKNLLAYWDNKKLPERIRGFYAGHRWLPYGLLKCDEIGKMDNYGGCSVALMCYDERKSAMYVPWNQLCFEGAIKPHAR